MIFFSNICRNKSPVWLLIWMATYPLRHLGTISRCSFLLLPICVVDYFHFCAYSHPARRRILRLSSWNAKSFTPTELKIKFKSFDEYLYLFDRAFPILIRGQLRIHDHFLALIDWEKVRRTNVLFFSFGEDWFCSRSRREESSKNYLSPCCIPALHWSMKNCWRSIVGMFFVSMILIRRTSVIMNWSSTND